MGISEMRIYADNIIYFLQRSGGGSVYWTELVKRLAGLDTTFIEPDRPTDNIFRKTLSLENIAREKKLPVQMLRYIPLSSRINAPAIFHSSYYRISLQKDIRNIVTVHDFTYEYFMRGFKQCVHSAQKKAAVTNAAGVICISENTYKDLCRFIPNASKRKIKVIHNGVNQIYHKTDLSTTIIPPILQPIQQRESLLYVGHRSTYKNFNVAIEVIKRLNNRFLLAIVGSPLSPKEKALLDTEIPGHYYFLGNISDEVLNIAYNLAYCLLYPSSYEGFGIPLLEAMRAHCPVVTTSLSSIPEVAGNGALMTDEADAGKLADAIRTLGTAYVRTELIAAAYNRSLQFSWDKCFSETVSFYDTIFHTH